MEEKHLMTLQPLDLFIKSNRKEFDLSKTFESVINRIPDLALPSTFRLAGEEDFFDRTKNIKLIPFRKQRVFETSISPDILRKKEKEKPLESAKLTRKEKFKDKDASCDNSKDDYRTRVIKDCESIQDRMLDHHRFDDSGLSNRNGIHKIEDRAVSTERSRSQNYVHREKIATSELPTEKPEYKSRYPFADPMPKCMKEYEKEKTVKDIIASTTDIEWTMLTPVRPSEEYEEKYFDLLISLHRRRHLSLLELGLSDDYRGPPFTHTRHSVLLDLDNGNRREQPKVRSSRSPSIRVNSSCWDDREHFDHGNILEIPSMTLTSYEEDEVDGHLLARCSDEDPQHEEFIYERFSRFSPDQAAAASQLGGENKMSIEPSRRQRRSDSDRASRRKPQRDMRQANDQVDDILSQLMDSAEMLSSNSRR